MAGLAIAVGGGLRLARDAGAGPGAVAGWMVVASLVAIAFAGWVVPRRGNRSLDFIFYSALSLGLLASAVGLVTTGDVRGVLWSGFAIVAVLVGRLSHPLTLWSLAALLALGAEVSAGCISGRVSTGGVIVVGLIVLGYVATVPRLKPALPSAADGAVLRIPRRRSCSWPASAPPSWSCTASGRWSSIRHDSGPPGRFAAVALALALALTRRTLKRPDLTWVAMLALVLGGIELAFVELPKGRASTLLVSFVFYGAALILVPRLAPPGRDLYLFSRPSEPRTVTRS